jgi:hypothetical protein
VADNGQVTLFSRGCAALLAAVVLAALLYGWVQHREGVRLRIVSENTAKAQLVKNAIERRLAVRAPEAEVLAFLKQAYPRYETSPSQGRTEYWIEIGKEPSGVWYCGSFTAYVRLDVREGRFTGAEIARRSFDCL